MVYRAGRILGCLLLLMMSTSLYSQDGAWVGEAGDGSVIKIDPQTQKAMRYSNGGVSPLWDGVHQLKNGSVIIVRNGIIITDPDSSGFRTPADELDRLPYAEDAACSALVEKVCGVENSCSEQPVCSTARQLLSLYEEESLQPGRGTQTAMQCIEALADEDYFVPCARDVDASPCSRLVASVCGSRDQCSGNVPCDAARQLLRLEMDELSGGGMPGQLETTQQCQEALSNTSFFTRCQR